MVAGRDYHVGPEQHIVTDGQSAAAVDVAADIDGHPASHRNAPAEDHVHMRIDNELATAAREQQAVEQAAREQAFDSRQEAQDAADIELQGVLENDRQPVSANEGNDFTEHASYLFLSAYFAMTPTVMMTCGMVTAA